MAVALPVALASPAHADRRQPEEIVLGPGNSPLGNDTSPLCPILDGTVYPALGCTGTLAQCVTNNSVTNNSVGEQVFYELSTLCSRIPGCAN